MLLFGLLGLIAFLLFVLIFLSIRNFYKNNNNSSTKLIQNELFNLSKIIDDKLRQTNFFLNDNLRKNLETNSQISKNANFLIEQITKKLTSIEETNKQIKDIWWQLEGLENILKNTKNRWILWEYFLENILKNIFSPENYKLQYKFKTWEIVDAVIFLNNKILPIDSKFSLENYNKILSSKDDFERKNYEIEFRKDIKKRIDETSKYIKIEENTLDFAFMFIPSEAIYYDLLVNKVWSMQNNSINLIEYAFRERKVIIVSPTSFYAYLQTIMQWLKALEIEKKAKEIKKHIFNLSKHLNSYKIYFSKIGNSLNTCLNHYEKANDEFNKIDKDIFKIIWKEKIAEKD